ncbi:MAG: Pr6Pr family membrane protein [Pseudomonadota bacterium]
MKLRTFFRISGASAAWTTLVAKYIVEATSGEHANHFAALLDYLSYFTHLSVFLVALAFSTVLLGPEDGLRKFFEKPATRAAIALYIIAVAVVHHLLLADLQVRAGWSAATNTMLHTVIPILYVIDWLVYAPKRRMTYRAIPFWLIYPAAYGVWAVGTGYIAGAYPYPFLDLNKLGLPGVGISMAGFVALFSIGAALFITIGKIVPPPVATMYSNTRVERR